MARKWEQPSRSHFSLPTAATLSRLVLVHLCAKFVSAMRTASCPELHEEAQLIDETWEY